jgi:hypothetical protein
MGQKQTSAAHISGGRYGPEAYFVRPSFRVRLARGSGPCGYHCHSGIRGRGALSLLGLPHAGPVDDKRSVTITEVRK